MEIYVVSISPDHLHRTWKVATNHSSCMASYSSRIRVKSTKNLPSHKYYEANSPKLCNIFSYMPRTCFSAMQIRNTCWSTFCKQSRLFLSHTIHFSSGDWRVPINQGQSNFWSAEGIISLILGYLLSPAQKINFIIFLHCSNVIPTSNFNFNKFHFRMLFPSGKDMKYKRHC